MSLFGIKEKKEIERLRAQINPEQLNLIDIQRNIEVSKTQLEQLTGQIALEQSHLDTLKAQIIETDEAILLQDFGVYTPHYAYQMSDGYKIKLKTIRNEQKALIKENKAVMGNHNWTVSGSKSKGTKMVSDMEKLLLRVFNAECDDTIEHVRFNNIENCEKKIRSSCEAISRLGAIMQIYITHNYMSLKIEELHLTYEYQVKKQEEKEAMKETRQRQREEAKAQKELEEARKKLEKEQAHYENALARINQQIAKLGGDGLPTELLSKKLELENQVNQIGANLRDVDYRAANQRAGYVYVISNIGAFGEDVYKIGMTRRLDPMDRVDELGDASVPFNFDVHAMIFTDDAPSLESALHNAFADRKVNFINQRREFFHVTLDEIKEVVRSNYDKTVEFVDTPPAEQYRESLLLKKASNNR